MIPVYGFLAVFYGGGEYLCVYGCHWRSFKEDNSCSSINSYSIDGHNWGNQVGSVVRFKKFNSIWYEFLCLTDSEICRSANIVLVIAIGATGLLVGWLIEFATKYRSLSCSAGFCLSIPDRFVSIISACLTCIYWRHFISACILHVNTKGTLNVYMSD